MVLFDEYEKHQEVRRKQKAQRQGQQAAQQVKPRGALEEIQHETEQELSNGARVSTLALKASEEAWSSIEGTTILVPKSPGV